MTAPRLPIEFRTSPAPLRAEPGSVSGGVRVLLRLEGFAVFAAALAAYVYSGFSWPAFALLFLVPDLSMLAYLGGPRAGAVGYNFAHTYASALVPALAGFAGGIPAEAAVGLIWSRISASTVRHQISNGIRRHPSWQALSRHTSRR